MCVPFVPSPPIQSTPDINKSSQYMITGHIVNTCFFSNDKLAFCCCYFPSATFCTVYVCPIFLVSHLAFRMPLTGHLDCCWTLFAIALVWIGELSLECLTCAIFYPLLQVCGSVMTYRYIRTYVHTYVHT
jgi:hypothetical protein